MNHIGPPLLLLLFSYALASHRVPKLTRLPGEVYHGYLNEEDRIVTVTPEITVDKDSGPVCSYVIKEPTDVDDAPFTFHVIDKNSGKVELKVKPGVYLDCSHSEYRITFVAKRCEDEEESDSSEIIITVKDTNNHVPEFERSWYVAEVEEGRIYDEIAKVKASDKDCGHPHGEICHYEIVNNKDIFAISDDGIVSNLRHLNASASPSHVLTIIAADCGMRKSKEVILTVKVHSNCHVGFNEVPSRMEYFAASGNKPLAPKGTLNLCGSDCKVEKIESRIELRTEHIGQGCDRESFASEIQRRICEVDTKTVELLPRPSKVKEEDRGNDVTDWKEDDDDEVYLFDGSSNAIVVPPETAKPYMSETFTLSFSMKHDKNPADSPHFKENIVCSSDDHKMNRHHFAVYIRHCKLEVLLRTEAADNIEEKYRPAEWRYTLGQVCDGTWHHYTINMNFPNLDVYVDGRALPITQKNPDILDDYPIPNQKDVKLRLVVGACWHGRTQKMDQFFKGWLASMLYLPKSNERPGVLQCLHQCKEQLKFEGLDRLGEGDKAVFNNEMSELTLETSNVDDLNTLIRKVSYVNLRDKPTPGHRQFSINTKVVCSNTRKPLEIAESSGYVLVSKAPEPILTLTATQHLARTAIDVKSGTNVLPDLKIKVQQKNENGDVVKSTSNKLKLDWCKITVTPKLDHDIEYFSSPASLIGSLNLDFTHDAEGLHLTGSESVSGYEQVLEQIHYFNVKPDQAIVRHFAVQCARNNVKSNKLDVMVSLKRTKVVEAPHIDRIVATVDNKPAEVHKHEQGPSEDALHLSKVDNRMMAHHEMEENLRQGARLQETLRLDTPGGNVGFDVHSPFVDNNNPNGASVAGGTVATVVIVCVGLLLTLVVVGVLKFKSNSRGYRKASSAEHGDLVWDDAGLNITVNPLEDVEKVAVEEDTSDEDSSDGEGSYVDDSEAEEESVLPHLDARATGLEWDDSSNLDSPPAPSKVQCL